MWIQKGGANEVCLYLVELVEQIRMHYLSRIHRYRKQ
jgi:hypothetical protein